jgi:PAS domain S-box-containing protein
MLDDEREDELLRSVALENARSIRAARKRAEEELFAAKEALRESEQRFRAVFERAAVGIAISELDGRLAEVNAKFCQILGYAAHELAGQTAYDISHPDDVATTRAYVARLVAGEIPDYSYEKRYLRKDGRVVWTLTSVGLLRDLQGQPRQFVGVIEDITALKNAQQGERLARAEAERMGELKDEFLATLSHELRTPLSAILGWSQVIARRPMSPEELKRAVEVIERNARAQTRLIEDLLDMSRITSGKVRLDVQPVEPAAFIEAALETVRPAADAKRIRLEKVLDPSAGPISGDASRLQQVIWNLLSNAIKFTRAGGKVQVVLARVNSHIEVSVADSGIGIKPEFLPYVFDRFRQADGSTTRRQGGLGLGLAIAKHLVELHGGSLHVQSAGEGRGATFTVQLPLTAVHRAEAKEERMHPAAAPAAPPPMALPDLRGLTILVVDDQPDARDLIQRVLEDAGARVVTAASVEEALALVELEKPQVLLSDIGMPEADGFDLLRQLRALGPAHGGDIPAIALTAFARSEDRTRALRAGFRLHVSKPVEPTELCVAVANVTGRTES